MEEKDTVKIGLEVHCQITSLKTKLFCGCSSNYRGTPANTFICPTCLGLPGALPTLNRKAVDTGILVALALNCNVAPTTFFVRKNYFYPDLPKNFQISQYDLEGGGPLSGGGHVSFTVNMDRRKVSIRRVHIEEDPGKLFYLGAIDSSPYTLVDYNRAGITLLEIVTEPEFIDPAEARAFLQKLRSILEHLGVSDGSLEGAMRCDANISLAGGVRIEVKNISSFKDVERALNFEIVRQRNLLKSGGRIRMETRHWDEAKRVTVSLRVKEEEQDYRYFPEPDLVPVEIDPEHVEELRRQMPELPDARKRRFIEQYSLPEYDAEVLTSERQLADFFEESAKLYGKPKAISNWLMGDVLQCLYSLEVDLKSSKLTPESLAEMLRMMDRGDISVKIAKKVLWEVMKTGKSPLTIVDEQGWKRITDLDMLEKIMGDVFKADPQAVKDALSDEKTINYLVGKVMERTSGRADPELTNKVIRKKLARIKAKRLE